MIYSYKGRDPEIHESCFIAPSADVIGKVKLAQDVNVWFQTVLRGDENEIIIGAGTNLQDQVTVHNAHNHPVVVGKNVTVGHQVLLHGCEVGDCSLIGMGATILDGAKIGSYTIIGANSLVTKGKEIPSGVLVMGSPAKVIRELSQEEKKQLEISALRYRERAKEYKEMMTSARS